MSNNDSLSIQKEIQVRFVTIDENIEVPNGIISIQTHLGSESLEQIIHALLKSDKGQDYEDKGLNKKKFGFVILGELLTTTVKELLSSKEVKGEVLEVTYLEKPPTPEPGSSSKHDSWLGGVAVRGQFVLTACYDSSVNVYGTDGKKILTIKEDGDPTMNVEWISLDENSATFASGGHDQVVFFYKYNIKLNSVELINAGKGHKKSIECLRASLDSNLLASGSHDSYLKVWSTKLVAEEDEGQEESSKKKSRLTTKKALTRTPITTLAGHKDSISDVDWLNTNEIITASQDHTIKIWDLELSGKKSEIVGKKAFCSLSYSQFNKSVITGSFDNVIRLYDPRSQEGSIEKCRFTSHQGILSQVRWCKEQDHLFSSCAYDNLVKVWDVRSYKAPLYDLKGHQDRVLCCDWGKKDIIASGGVDQHLRIFKTNL